jgi:hypothetical protein
VFNENECILWYPGPSLESIVEVCNRGKVKGEGGGAIVPTTAGTTGIVPAILGWQWHFFFFLSAADPHMFSNDGPGYHKIHSFSHSISYDDVEKTGRFNFR